MMVTSLNALPAGKQVDDILVRWLAYADDTCILAECKEELTAISVFLALF